MSGTHGSEGALARQRAGATRQWERIIPERIIPVRLSDGRIGDRLMPLRLPRWRRAAEACPGPRPNLPSLDLLLRVAMQEREKQLDHYDALDTKAGVLLAFAGVLIVVARGIRFAYLLPGTVFARQLASPHCCSLRPATDQVGASPHSL